ncbi:hypothetical protein P280DRAFT_388984 [Massarina eburnea CBS 473.64]|uniref:Uncharacterized protein n=1 Tax=Massarina eburnea CBS 473.64 TaxID=1395130 RepID=A0A6A6SDL5_9PLEO|nr:hypothetical protein P280DRAFT_388984 [Massarina eburnea CBS 473.64]
MCGTDCFLMLLSVLFPPIGVWVKRGICSADSLINIALSCLGFLPGLLHAWYIILHNPDPYEYEGVQDRERSGDGSVTYYYVSRPAPQHPAGSGQTTYGTVGGSQPSEGQFPGQNAGGIPGQKLVHAHNGVGGRGGPSELQGESAGAGASEPAEPPPTYADVIKGDHKVQNA